MNIIKVKVEGLEAHPLSQEIFGHLPPEQFEDLTQDIEERGLRYPLELDVYQRVICGSQRLRAVQRLGWETVEASICDQLVDEESIREWLIKDNILRRQLTPGQVYRAGKELERIISVKAERRALANLQNNPAKEEICKSSVGSTDPVGESGRTNDIVGRELGTSPANYKRIKKIFESDDEELKQQVDQGFVSTSAAAKKVTKPAHEAQKIPPDDNRALFLRYIRWQTGVEKFRLWLENNPPGNYGMYEEEARTELAKLKEVIDD